MDNPGRYLALAILCFVIAVVCFTYPTYERGSAYAEYPSWRACFAVASLVIFVGAALYVIVALVA